MKKILFILILASYLTTGMFEYIDEITTQVVTIFESSFCVVYTVIWYIAGFLASLVIVAEGIKWVQSGDDPGQRQRSKDTIMNVFYALIFISISKVVAEMLIQETFNCVI